MNKLSFASLGLSAPIVRAVTERGYSHPTPIQAQAIPAVLSGGDLLAGAQTGTGKTAGFTLPILQLLADRAAKRPASTQSRQPIRVLILVPTRELAAQVEESVREYGKYLKISSTVVFGGVNINAQISRLRKTVDVLIATPGRLLDHLQQKTVDLSQIEIFVLDEADRMLDMGFIRDIKRVLAVLPKKVGNLPRQNLLFSATFSDEIKALADGLLNKPALLEVERRQETAELITQKIIMIDQKAKRSLLAHLIKKNDWHQVLVFTRTKHGANRLAEQLSKDNISALAIHGNKSQGARTRALAEFKSGSLQVLVATDIAARGLDIELLPHVINFELPNVPEDYVHRIGRTGRAGASGEALSFVSNDELAYLRDIEKLTKQKLPREVITGFVPSITEEAPRGPRPVQSRGQRNQRTNTPKSSEQKSREKKPAHTEKSYHAETKQASRGKNEQHKKLGDQEKRFKQPDQKRSRASQSTNATSQHSRLKPQAAKSLTGETTHQRRGQSDSAHPSRSGNSSTNNQNQRRTFGASKKQPKRSDYR